ncbi:hypothetical protein MNV49_006090 [Pseudohyphozyma bogoriensis]|nr:hypothetical protein MNV49_006090 [Pseudohyphozyma bogoriensis]
MSQAALPEEFQAEHGSIDLSGGDQKPVDDGEKDLELDTTRGGQRVWLVKVPRFLMEKWSAPTAEGQTLGRVRVYDEKDANGDPKIAVMLDEPAPAAGPSTGKKVPTEYKLTLQNTSSKNLFVFGEKEEEVVQDDEELGDDDDEDEGAPKKKRRITSMLGTIHHECLLTPSLSSTDASSSYRNIMRDRQKKAAEPKRTIKMLDVDQGTSNRLASGMGIGIKNRVSNFVKAKPTVASTGEGRAARMPRNELLDLLFTHFENKPYWSVKALTEHVKQPQVYLKEVLADIAILIPRGPYAQMYKLKEEFTRKEAKPAEEEKEEDEEEDMEEVK